MKLSRIAAFAIAVLAASPSLADELKWSDWGDDLFARAAAEKRFVIELVVDDRATHHRRLHRQ